jgi:hypothetical protein
MRTILRIGACYLAMIFTLPIVLLAGDLLDGTWDLDIAASKYDPGPARKSDTTSAPYLLRRSVGGLAG